MAAKMNLYGRRFGKLVVKDKSRKIIGIKWKPVWICKCDCGNTVRYTTADLIYKRKEDCGNCRVKKEKAVAENKPVEKKEPIVEKKVVEKRRPVKKDFHKKSFKPKTEVSNESSKTS